MADSIPAPSSLSKRVIGVTWKAIVIATTLAAFVALLRHGCVSIRGPASEITLVPDSSLTLTPGFTFPTGVPLQAGRITVQGQVDLPNGVVIVGNNVAFQNGAVLKGSDLVIVASRIDGTGTIDASGRDASVRGAAGGPGGRVLLAAGDVSLGIRILAKGGRGGDGTPGPDGLPGRDGRCEGFGGYRGADRGGDGQPGGDGGPGGSGGDVVVIVDSDAGSSLHPSPDVSGGRGGAPGAGGAPGQGGRGCVGLGGSQMNAADGMQGRDGARGSDGMDGRFEQRTVDYRGIAAQVRSALSADLNSATARIRDILSPGPR